MKWNLGWNFLIFNFCTRSNFYNSFSFLRHDVKKSSTVKVETKWISLYKVTIKVIDNVSSLMVQLYCIYYTLHAMKILSALTEIIILFTCQRSSKIMRTWKVIFTSREICPRFFANFLSNVWIELHQAADRNVREERKADKGIRGIFHGGSYNDDCREHIATNSPILNGKLPHSPDLFPNDYYLSLSLWNSRTNLGQYHLLSFYIAKTKLEYRSYKLANREERANVFERRRIDLDSFDRNENLSFPPSR